MLMLLFFGCCLFCYFGGFFWFVCCCFSIFKHIIGRFCGFFNHKLIVCRKSLPGFISVYRDFKIGYHATYRRRYES